MHTTRITKLTIAATALTLGLTACGSSGHHAADGPTTTAPVATDPLPSSSTTTTTTPGKTSTTTAPPETTTTVLGPHGPASKYPAAQPTPPSLAGAYPHDGKVNLITVLKTLVTYRDWVWSHPDPNVVARYDDPAGGAFYTGEVKTLRELQQLGVHASPSPSTVLWARVLMSPRRDRTGRFAAGEIETVNKVPRLIPLLTAADKPSGRDYRSAPSGLVVYKTWLVQAENGQFRLLRSQFAHPSGGVRRLMEN